MRRSLPALPLLFLALATGLAACSSDEGTRTAVTATDTSCQADKTDFSAGKNTFEVTNRGSEVTELYVYGPGDRVISEVENVTPGTSRSLTVDLGAGTYQLACKPGQKGDGIRQDIKVSGEGGKEQSKPADRTVTLTAVDYSFELPNPAIKQGETIEFEMRNTGREKHEFEVFAPDDKVLGEVEETDAGKTRKATISFDQPGNYRYICDIDDHKDRGMTGTLTVAAR